MNSNTTLVIYITQHVDTGNTPHHFTAQLIDRQNKYNRHHTCTIEIIDRIDTIRICRVEIIYTYIVSPDFMRQYVSTSSLICMCV